MSPQKSFWNFSPFPESSAPDSSKNLMRKLLKILAWLSIALLAIVLLAVSVVYWKSNTLLRRTHQVTVTSSVPSAPDSETIDRGKHIAETRGCVECHGKDFGGAMVMDNPAMGRIHGPNLTRGRGGLAPDFSANDWELAIRHGVTRDGRGLFLMPSEDYAGFSTRDMDDLVDFMYSLPPVDRESVPLRIGPVARALMLAGKIQLAADKIEHATVTPSTVVPAVTAEYGKYLAASCTGCHGANLSGGKIASGPPDWPPAANLSPSGDLPKWSEPDFIAALREFHRPDGRPLNPVMPHSFGKLNDIEVKALWTYLQTIPAAATGSR